MRPPPMQQLRDLLLQGTIQIEQPGLPADYEVTVFYGGTHRHYGGATLSEALNRAWTEHCSSPAKVEP